MNIVTPATFEPSSQKIWDVVVIGAGPAGTVAARQLSMQGLQILLIERRRWPRQKVCGGCLNERAISLLEVIGMRKFLQRVNASVLKKLIVQARGRRAEVDLPGGAAICRSEFDAALVAAAVETGVTFISDTSATVARETVPASTRQVVLTHPSGVHESVFAKLVIAADGLGHPSLKELPEFACNRMGSRVGLSISVDLLPAEYRTGIIYMAVSKTGYVGLVRTTGDRGNLAAAIESSALKLAKEPAELVRGILADAGLVVPRLTGGDAWRGTIPLMRRTNRLSSHRVLLLGDAAGYTEPFTGEGIAWAISSALAAVPLVLRNLRVWDMRRATEWEANERRRMSHGQITSRIMAELLRRPLAVQVALTALRAIPSLFQPLVQKVYGTSSIEGEVNH